MNTMDARSAAPLGVIALGTQLFFTIAIDFPTLLNSGWIAALAACLLSLPLGFLLVFIKKQRRENDPLIPFAHPLCRLFLLLLCLFSLYDAGCAMHIFRISTLHTAFENTRAALFYPILALCAVICCFSGVQAVGGAARVCMGILVLLLIVILAAQLPSMNGRWLFPLMGPGREALAAPLPRLCALMTGFLPLWLMTDEKKGFSPRLSIPSLMIYASLAVGMLLIFYYMLSPLMLNVPDTRLFWLDRLLTNGRVSVSLQLAMLLLWHTCVLLLLFYSLASSAWLLEKALPRIAYRRGVVLCAVVSLAVPLFSLARSQIISWVSTLRWPLITLFVAGLFFIRLRQNLKEKRP